MRLLIDKPLSGIENMARDEALLQTTAATGTPALRLYFWEQPCLSLGYFQKYEDREGHHASRSCECVRRSSGGGAILHHHELTYSYAVPVEATTRSTEAYYDAFHDSLVETFAAYGVTATTYRNAAAIATAEQPSEQPFLCFQRRTDADIVANGVKLTGSAQRKRYQSLLQHGSVLLKMSAFAPELPGAVSLSETHDTLEPLEFAHHWLPLLASRLQVQLVEGDWADEELHLAAEIGAGKFSQSAWTRKR